MTADRTTRAARRAALFGGATPDTARRCIVTGEIRPKTELIRFVAGPDGTVTPDIAGKLPGRGLWVTATRDALGQAVKRKAFARAAKAQVTVPDGLADLTARLLRDRCLALLGQARGAGLVTSGATLVAALLSGPQAGSVALVLHARDGAEDGLRKIAGKARGVPLLRVFTAEELGLALGRESVVHAALTRGGLTDRLLTDARRYAGFTAPAP
ncbi:MAG: RNA-binding protein [Alphaproteobacteria bacterium]|nr:RNA-binding protein [Alphaproteobacteria bacterium]MDX5368551.1 RNA-binding protein [Alphaproteobacteria bacterium]MDX5463307.1 RNA-binding protein [Alphaproteobacteria bacterium]